MYRRFMIGAAVACMVSAGGVALYAQGTPQTVTLTRVETTMVQNAMRASDIIGSTVINDRKDKVGSIDDLLIENADKKMFAVLNVGGFLGMGERHVLVSFDQLKMGAMSGGRFDREKVMLPGATKQALANLPAFEYKTN
jgi:hypothetical protein